MIECKLLSSERQTAFGGLCVLGHLLARDGALEALSGVEIAQKTVRHSPTQKLTDALMGILSGCKAVYETSVRVRPDAPLRRAFGRRDGCAEQSTIQRTLDAFTEENVEGGFNRSVQHARFSVLSRPEVRKWRGWVVLEGCRRRARKSCGSGGGTGSP